MKLAARIVSRAWLILIATVMLLGCEAVLRLFPNEIPIADAGPDQSGVLVDSTVYLDGSGSRDPDGDELSFTWFYMDRPVGSTAGLYNYLSEDPYFTPDLAGTYVFFLIVDDGLEESRPDKVQIDVVP